MLRVKNNDIDSTDNELGIQFRHFNIKPVYFIDDMKAGTLNTLVLIEIIKRFLW